MIFYDLFFKFLFVFSVSNPPTSLPKLETTESSNDVFDDDDDSQETFTDDNENVNVVYTLDKSN